MNHLVPMNVFCFCVFCISGRYNWTPGGGGIRNGSRSFPSGTDLRTVEDGGHVLLRRTGETRKVRRYGGNGEKADVREKAGGTSVLVDASGGHSARGVPLGGTVPGYH